MTISSDMLFISIILSLIIVLTIVLLLKNSNTNSLVNKGTIESDVHYKPHNYNITTINTSIQNVMG